LPQSSAKSLPYLPLVPAFWEQIPQQAEQLLLADIAAEYGLGRHVLVRMLVLVLVLLLLLLLLQL
jgi:hypothetical protein